MHHFILFLVLILNTFPLSGQCWKQISGGSLHSLAATPNNRLWAWGDNAFGQLGKNYNFQAFSPVLIDIGPDWGSIDANYGNSASIKTDGYLYIWGSNNKGQLGIGPNAPNLVKVPTLVNLAKWTQVSIGNEHVLGIQTDGSLWAWGNNASGELGDGTQVSSDHPVQIGSDKDWIAISAGNHFCFAIKKDSSLWAWGDNQFGQLGDSTMQKKIVPVPIRKDKKWKQVDAGFRHTLAIDASGKLWNWGQGAIGSNLPGTFPKSTPILVDSIKLWQKVCAGNNFSLALNNAHTLWAWGSNTSGQVGNGGFGGDIPTLSQIGQDSIWQDIATGSNHCLAIDQSGELWAWGFNVQGQLGQGNTLNLYAPTKVSCPYTDVQVLSAKAPAAQLFPLPTKDVLYLQLFDNQTHTIKYRILNPQGAEVIAFQVLMEDASIDVTALVPGVYFLQLQLDGQNVVQRFVKI
ncbi:MAG: T9SS type A sorting domain-containing protein [Bacteroidetes bacterium]|nr:T9SS type A sorting domain-containing protein [Bacteroidota bacterium]